MAKLINLSEPAEFTILFLADIGTCPEFDGQWRQVSTRRYGRGYVAVYEMRDEALAYAVSALEDFAEAYERGMVERDAGHRRQRDACRKALASLREAA